MKKIMVLIRRKAGTSREAFMRYYEEHHVPLALCHIGPFILDYRRNYVAQELGYAVTVANAAQDRSTPQFGYDVMTEIWFKDQAAADGMFRTLSEPAIRDELREDEERFLDRETVRVIFCDEFRTAPGATAG